MSKIGQNRNTVDKSTKFDTVTYSDAQSDFRWELTLHPFVRQLTLTVCEMKTHHNYYIKLLILSLNSYIQIVELNLANVLEWVVHDIP